MVDKFIGTWKIQTSENFDDYMKALGKKTILDFNMSCKKTCFVQVWIEK